MVKIGVVANNERDSFERRWLIVVDKLPPLNWSLSANFDGVSFVEAHTQGQLMQTQLNLPDGKHTIYFAVSVPDSGEWGTYSGGIQMDGVSGEFTGIDVDTVAAFEIEVKDNVAVKRVNQSGIDIDPNDVSEDNIFMKKFKEFRRFTMKNAKATVAVSATAFVVIVAGYIGVDMWRKGNRRL
jgi:hypothetical protein